MPAKIVIIFTESTVAIRKAVDCSQLLNKKDILNSKNKEMKKKQQFFVLLFLIVQLLQVCLHRQQVSLSSTRNSAYCAQEVDGRLKLILFLLGHCGSLQKLIIFRVGVSFVVDICTDVHHDSSKKNEENSERIQQNSFAHKHRVVISSGI